MKKIRITQLKTFLAVVEHNGFKNAAVTLNKTQPAISQAIKLFEASLKQPLFIDNSAKLTSYGEVLLPHIRSYIENYDELHNILFKNESNKNNYDTLSLITQPSIAQSLLPQIIKSFVKDYPYVKIKVIDTSIYQINKLIAKGKADLAICTTHDIDKSFNVTPILNDKYGVVSNINHTISNELSIDWNDLNQHRLIQNSTWDPAEIKEFKSISNSAYLNISNMNSLITLLESGAGLTVLPYLAFPEKNHQLKFIDLINPNLSRQIGVVYNPDNKLSEVANNMRTHIMQNYLVKY